MIKGISFLGFLALMSSAALNAQVGINNTAPKATLDVSASKNPAAPEGIIAPRIKGDVLQGKDDSYKAPQDGALVYVTEACSAPYGKTTNVKAPGYYYYDAYAENPFGELGLWIAIGSCGEQWFYMPSFNLPVTPPIGPAGMRPFNLYREYERQFIGMGTTSSAGSAYGVTGKVSGTETSPGVVAYIWNLTPVPVDRIEFYVTAYSDVITIDHIDANGDMFYYVNSLVVPDGSFIDVVFRIK